MGSIIIFTPTYSWQASVAAGLLGSAALSRAGGTSASASSGGGGWQVVDRARQGAATEWLDYYPFVMTMKCILDGGTGTSPASVEQQCGALEAFELPVAGAHPPQPPILVIGGPVPHTDLFWVCSKLAFTGGETGAIRDDNTGERTQQSFTIELTEYRPSQAITAALSPAQQAALNLGSQMNQTTVSTAGQTYTIQEGDTLQSIAARVMGNVALWPQLAILNNIPVGGILTPGWTLAIPATS